MPRNNRSNTSKKIRTSMSALASSNAVKNLTKQVKKLAVKEGKRRVVNAVIPRAVNYMGGRIGVPPNVSKQIGNTVAAHVNRLIGSGDYTMSQPATNSLIKGAKGTAPSFEPRQVRISHREYICDIFTDASTVGAFKNNQFVCNPSDAATFPYISSIAALYEKYRFKGLVFEFVSTVGQYTAGALGSVIMTSAFNTSLTQFVNKAQMENMENAISFRTDTSGLYGVECKDQVQNWFYTKHFNATVKANTNVANIYDLADFSLATYGGSIPVGTNIGELWVSVDVEFEGPRLPDQRAAFYHCTTAAATSGGPLQGSSVVQYGTLGSATIGNNNTINFNNVIVGDVYMLNIVGRSSTALTVSVEPTYSGITIANDLFSDTTSATTEIGTAFAYQALVSITSKNAYFVINVLTGISTGTSLDVVITPVAFGANLADL